MRFTLARILTAAAALAAAHPPAGSASSAERMVADLRGHSLDPAVVDRMAAILRDCEAAGLPMDSLRVRLQEGIAKNASQESLVEALEVRARALRRARALADEAGFGQQVGAVGHELLNSLASAIESGMPEAVLQEAVGQSGGGSAYRLQTVVECGEGLHLAGVESDGILAFMRDCLSRGLGRMEVLRASRFVMQRHREGVPCADILKELWGDGEADGRGRGRGHRHGASRGEP
jgi:hypothetical protein